ncbi:MAG: hypothetical protein LBG72_03565, partial [Spirochaetaceae bacterium]|nr:hypothetical protein [Spirochaetaceae bacterium]
GFKFILWENGQYGSLVTEVALGYSLALGGGDDFDKHTAPFTGTIDSGLLAILGGVILAGGPRISLNIGWLY